MLLKNRVNGLLRKSNHIALDLRDPYTVLQNVQFAALKEREYFWKF